MADTIDLFAILNELDIVDVLFHRTDPTLEVAVVQLSDDHRVLAVERTYRSGVSLILEPSEEEMDIAREGDLWRLWNSERAKHVLELRKSLELKSTGT